jgi:hypothetical protein
MHFWTNTLVSSCRMPPFAKVVPKSSNGSHSRSLECGNTHGGTGALIECGNTHGWDGALMECGNTHGWNGALMECGNIPLLECGATYPGGMSLGFYE